MARNQPTGAGTSDHRGHAVEAIGSTMRSWTRSNAADLEEVSRQLVTTRTVRRYRALKWILGIGISLTLIGAIALVLGSPRSSEAWVWFAYFILIVVATAATTRAFKTPLAKFASEDVLGLGRCAQCLYLISDLVPEPDGCVVCPECGAAWFAASIGKPMETISYKPAD